MGKLKDQAGESPVQIGFGTLFGLKLPSRVFETTGLALDAILCSFYGEAYWSGVFVFFQLGTQWHKEPLKRCFLRLAVSSDQTKIFGAQIACVDS